LGGCLIDQAGVLFGQRPADPADIDCNEDDEQLEREQQVNNLEDVDNGPRLAAIQVVDVEDDSLDRLAGLRLASVAVVRRSFCCSSKVNFLPSSDASS